jgi:hypothetical protein
MRKSFILLLALAGIMGAQEAKWHPNDLLRSAPSEEQKAASKDAGKWLVGIEAGYERVWDSWYGYNTANYGIKFGYILQDNNRIYLNYNRNTDMEEEIGSAKATATLQKVLLGLESVSYATANFGIIYGGAIGWAYLSGEAKSNSISVKVSESALAVGLKVGGIYSIGEHNEIEFGVKAGGSFFEETEWNAGAYAGYSFKF